MREALRRLHQSVALGPVSDRVTFRTKGGATIASVPLSWESDEDVEEETTERLLWISGFVRQEDLGAEPLEKGWEVEIEGAVYTVYTVNAVREGGVDFRARRGR